MIWALLCGLFFGWVVRAARQKGIERRRAERIISKVREALPALEQWEKALDGQSCQFDIQLTTPCSELDDLPFSDEPCCCEECCDCDAELPEFVVSRSG